MQIKIGNFAKQDRGENLEALAQRQNRSSKGAQRKKESRANIFAGDLPMNQDPIAVRRQQAQKKAMKLVKDVWDGDRKMSQTKAEIQKLQMKQQEEALQNQELARGNADRMEALREGYGVAADSEEQKDLELLLRASDPTAALTEEERARVGKLWQGPLTEYQREALAINGEKNLFERRAENAKQYAQALQSSLTDMEIEKLKSHKMWDAEKGAEELVAQAGKETLGALVEEGKERLDKEREEEREAAKEKAEENEAQAEKIELRREQKELMEARVEAVQEQRHKTEEVDKEQGKDAREEAELLQDMAEAGFNVAGAGAVAQAEIKDMLNKMKLIEADIKGIAVDEEV